MKNMVFAKSTKLSRRKFIVGSAAVAGGGLALGLNVPFGIDAVQAQGAATEVNSPALPSSLRRNWSVTGIRWRPKASHRAVISRASGPGAKWARAAAAGYARRRIMFGVEALQPA